MSYILDALKKSEQERGHGRIPDVQTVHSSSLNYRSEKTSYWPYILIAAVILNLLAIIYFNYDENDDKTVAEAISTTTDTIVTNQSSTPSGPPPAIITPVNEQPKATPLPEKQSPEKQPVMKQRVMSNPVLISKTADKDLDKASTDTSIPASTTAASTGHGSNETYKEAADKISKPGSPEIMTEQKDTSSNNREPAPASIQSSTMSSGETSRQAHTQAEQTSAESNIIEYYDLPVSISSQLPAIIISAHIFSTNPEQRSIVINNKFLEEGDYVIDDLILYEITYDGAIFLYDGVLFHHGVVGGWQ